MGPEASSADPDGPPPGFDATASAPPSQASLQEPELILTDLPEVLTGPEDELVPEGPASAGTEVLESVHGEDIVVPGPEEEVVVEETIPEAVDVSETVVEDVSPESEEPPSEIVAKEFITGSTSVVLAKPTVESSEEASLVETTGQQVTEAPPGDVVHQVQDTAVTAEEPSEMAETGPESSVAEGDGPAGPPSEHPPDGGLTPDGSRTRTSPSEPPALTLPGGEFEEGEIFLGVTPDPVPETEVPTQDRVLTTSGQTAVEKVTFETSGATTEDAAEETPNTSDDESQGEEETPKETEGGVAQVLEGETTITAAQPSRTPASKEEPEEGEHAEEPTEEADGTEELLEESTRAGGKPEEEPEFVEEGPKRTEEKVPTGASQQEPGVEAETGPAIPSAPLEDPEVTLEKVDEDDVAETEEEGSLPATVNAETSEETTTEADEVEGLLPGSGVEETSEPETEVPVNPDEEVPPEAAESTAVVEPTGHVLESIHDSEKEPVPEPPSVAPPEVGPHPGETNRLDETSPESPGEPVLHTSPVRPTEVFSEVEKVASPEEPPATAAGVTPKYVVEYNNGNFPDLTEGPFGGDEDPLGNDGFDLDDEEENSVRSADSSADAFPGHLTPRSRPQIGNEIDDGLLWPPKPLTEQMVEMSLKLRGETYNDALRDRSSVHYQQLARHFTRRVRWPAPGPTSNQYRKPVGIKLR